MLDPRAIAVQGIGFAPALIAAQGLGTLADELPVEAHPSIGRRPVKRRRDGDNDVLLFLLR